MCSCDKVDECKDVVRAYSDGVAQGREVGAKAAGDLVMKQATSEFTQGNDTQAQFLRKLANDIYAV